MGVEDMEFPGVSKKEDVEIPVSSDKPKNYAGFFQKEYDLNLSTQNWIFSGS